MATGASPYHPCNCATTAVKLSFVVFGSHRFPSSRWQHHRGQMLLLRRSFFNFLFSQLLSFWSVQSKHRIIFFPLAIIWHLDVLSTLTIHSETERECVCVIKKERERVSLWDGPYRSIHHWKFVYSSNKIILGKCKLRFCFKYNCAGEDRLNTRLAVKWSNLCRLHAASPSLWLGFESLILNQVIFRY